MTGFAFGFSGVVFVRHEVPRLRAFPSTLSFDATGGPLLGMTGEGETITNY